VIILRELLGAELDRLRVQLLPLRGGKELPATIDSLVLFDFTDAHLVALLDATSAADVEAIWLDAQARFLASGADAATSVLREGLSGRQAEHKWLREWLQRALTRGRAARVHPFGLEKPDVIMYLPVRELVPGRKDWEHLEAEHAEWQANSSNRLNFKAWLRRQRQGKLEDEDIRRAVQSMDHIPHEFLNLLSKLREVAAQPRDTVADTNT
jgi:hypothetical protein